MFRLEGPAILLALTACSSTATDYTPPPGAPKAVSFKSVVQPLLNTSCALAACHGSTTSNLGIYLPFDPDKAYASLMGASPTAIGMKFVAPGDPDHSYLLLKISGKQAGLPACGARCGKQMPLDLPPLAQADQDHVRAWIVAGAKND